MTPKETELKSQDAFENLVLGRTYLFDHGHPYTPPSEYLKHFFWEGEVFFTEFLPPWHYEIEFLDQFKKNIVNSSTIIHPSGQRTFMVIIQISPGFHIHAAVYFSPEDERLIVQAHLFCRDPKVIPEFVKANSELRVRPKIEVPGFRLGFPSNGVPQLRS